MAVESAFQTDLSDLSDGHIQMYLDDYEAQVTSLAELAAEWDELDGEQRMHYEAEFDLALGRRLVLEQARASDRLTREQEALLQRADRLAEAQREVIRSLFGTDVEELLGRVAFASREKAVQVTEQDSGA